MFPRLVLLLDVHTLTVSKNKINFHQVQESQTNISIPSSPSANGVDLTMNNEESDDEMEWEEVPVLSIDDVQPATPVEEDMELTETASIKTGNLEITLRKAETVDSKRKQRAVLNAELRTLRVICHKIHTVALLGNALVRNTWINDPLLQARLLSLVPMAIQIAFMAITKKRHPEPAKRGRLFETAMMRLTQWWYETFDVLDYGHIRSRTFDQVQNVLLGLEDDSEEGEVIRSSKSLMKRALIRQGSKDVSAQLFTALCRALGIPARLVVSLQSVPWQANVGRYKHPGRGQLWQRKGEEEEDDSIISDEGNVVTESNDEWGGAYIPGTMDAKGKKKAVSKPTVKLRKSSSSGRKVFVNSTNSTPPIGGFPPAMWTEVFSRPDGKWMPIDPIRYIVNRRKVFEPPPHDKDNRMVYVVAVEEDGYCRDVTPRYAKDYSTKTSKAQLSGKSRKEWWESVMKIVTRPYRLNRDDVEDEEFVYNQHIEGMPSSVVGFKNHPLYVLEQHLKRDEVVFPKTELGKFRGESVYPRSNVVPLKTAENWMRSGRRVKEGVQAMKWVKQRAVTIHRRRAMELAQQDGDEMVQGLYSEEQTELYIPDPIIDGIIPKNEFGNIDLYTPSMLPAGAEHIPYKGAGKVARNLGFDYAEAVTSFEFKKGRAFPIISGIVIAAENKDAILEAYWETERDAEEKERTKRMERVLKKWIRLVQGLRIRRRLQEQYASGEPSTSSQQKIDQEAPLAEFDQPGGFLTEADTVVQPFHLPRFEHGAYQPFDNGGAHLEQDELVDKIMNRDMTDRSDPEPPQTHLQNSLDYNQEPDLEEVIPAVEDQNKNFTGKDGPKTMRELAEAAQASIPTNSPMTSGSPLKNTAKSSMRNQLTLANATGLNPRGTQQGSKSSDPGKRSSSAAARRKATRARRESSDESEDVAFDSQSEIGYAQRTEEADIAGTDGGGEDLPVHPHKNIIAASLSMKRKRTRSNPATPVPSTRVLRTRVPKSAEVLKSEREAEAMYRRAIAE